MKIKLTQEVLDSGGLPSTGSHQGFTVGVWNLLNSGKVVEVDNSVINTVRMTRR